MHKLLLQSEPNLLKLRMVASFGLVQDNVDTKVKPILFFMEIRKIWLRPKIISVKNFYTPTQAELWKFMVNGKNPGPRLDLNTSLIQRNFKISF